MENPRKMRDAMRGFACVVICLISGWLLGIAPANLAAADSWVEKANMPTGRRSMSAAVVDGKIYVIGGAVGNWSATSAVEEYDPATDKWTKKENMPTPRFRFATCVVNGKIYAIGGTQNDGTDGVLAKVEEYDPVTNKWTKKTDMPTARHSLSASNVDGMIYAIGGGKGSVVLSAPTGFDVVEQYDPKADKWTRKASQVSPRYGHAACVVNGRIYILGGAWGLQKPGRTTRAVEVYDPTEDKWEEKGEAADVQLYHAGSVAGGRIYTFGGVVDLGGLDVSSAVNEYDPVLDLWTKKADMLAPASAVSNAVVDGRIYVFGGWLGWIKGVAGVVLRTTAEYTPDGWPFAVSPEDKLESTWGEIRQGR